MIFQFVHAEVLLIWIVSVPFKNRSLCIDHRLRKSYHHGVVESSYSISRKRTTTKYEGSGTNINENDGNDNRVPCASGFQRGDGRPTSDKVEKHYPKARIIRSIMIFSHARSADHLTHPVGGLASAGAFPFSLSFWVKMFWPERFQS